MNTAQSRHYEVAGDQLMAEGRTAEAERAYRAAQRHMDMRGNLADWKRLQAKLGR